MRTFLWVVFLVSLSGFALWILFRVGVVTSPPLLFLLFTFFAAPSIGGMWMIYLSIRYEEHPLTFVLLAFVPYAFVWYYFDRARLGKHMTRQSSGAPR